MIWIILIILAVLLITGSGSKGNRNRKTTPYRIDHPHYITDDESECSVCGTRFSKKLSSCPGAEHGLIRRKPTRKSGTRSLTKSANGTKRKGGKKAPVDVIVWKSFD